MMRRKLFRLVGLGAALLLASGMRAQAEQVTYVAEDRSVAFEYPADWSFEVDRQQGFLYLRDDGLNLTLYTPAVLDDYLIGNIADPSILVGLVLAVNDLTELELETTNLNGRSAATFTYHNESEDNSGLLTAVQFRDGRLGLIDAYMPGDIVPYTDEILSIVATFDVPPAPAPELLNRYNAPWQDAVAELEASEFIMPGGNLVFVQPSAFAAGTGTRFQGLAQQLAHQDVIVAGRLTFTTAANPGSDSCGLVARYGSDADYIWVGQDSDGDVFATDYINGATGSSLSADLDLTPGQSHHFLFIAQGTRLIVYVDGVLVLDDMRVTERAGSYGLALSSTSAANCAVNNMWVYQLAAAVEPGACQITSTGGTVNKRSGAGVNFEIVGQLAFNASAVATGQASGSDGLTWWLLDDGGWVREDVVDAQGACEVLPLVAP